MQDKIDANKTKAAYMLDSNMSEEGRIYLASSHLHNFPTKAASFADAEVVKVADRLAKAATKGYVDNAVSDKPEDIKANKAFIEDAVTRTLNAVEAKNEDTPKAVAEGAKIMNNYIKSVVDQANSKSDYKSFGPIVDFLSSANGAKWSENVRFDPGLKDELSRVIQIHYGDKVATNLNRYWSSDAQKLERDMVLGVTSAFGGPRDESKVTSSMKDSYEPVLSGNSIVLRPNSKANKNTEGYYSESVNQFQNAVNKYARMVSNLQGIPMSQVYNEVILPTVFGVDPKKKEEIMHLDIPNWIQAGVVVTSLAVGGISSYYSIDSRVKSVEGRVAELPQAVGELRGAIKNIDDTMNKLQITLAVLEVKQQVAEDNKKGEKGPNRPLFFYGLERVTLTMLGTSGGDVDTLATLESADSRPLTSVALTT